MADKIKELLAVLDLPKEGLDSWLKTTFQVGIAKNKLPHYMSICSTSVNLADLAFRLRDEAVETSSEYGKDFETVAIALQNYVLHPPPSPQLGKTFQDYLYAVRASSMWVDNSKWWLRRAKPIHWIIAALIAKELTNDK